MRSTRTQHTQSTVHTCRAAKSDTKDDDNLSICLARNRLWLRGYTSERETSHGTRSDRVANKCMYSVAIRIQMLHTLRYVRRMRILFSLLFIQIECLLCDNMRMWRKAVAHQHPAVSNGAIHETKGKKKEEAPVASRRYVDICACVCALELCTYKLGNSKRLKH